MKPESEDSSLSSSSSSYSESSDEVSSKGKTKELPPPPPHKKKHRSRSPPHSRVNIQSLDPDPILRNKGMINEADLSLQAEMINADIDHGRGAICTPGPKDPHCV